MAEYDFHFTAEVMDGIFGEVIEARGAWDTLGERLDNIEQSAGGDTYTKTEVDTMLAEKVDKVTGKGLSTNDFTNEDKAQISANTAGIGALANAGAKNVLNVTATSREVNGVTFTVNADSSVTMSGTATARAQFQLAASTPMPNLQGYILNGAVVNDSGATINFQYSASPWTVFANDTGNGAAIGNYNNASNIAVFIDVPSGATVDNLIFKPMIRNPNIEDDTYVPYGMTNAELTKTKANQAETTAIANRGSKNLLKIAATTQTINGVTFTVNSDDTITIDTNGQASTAAATLTLATASQINAFLPLGTYKLSGCTDGSTSTYDLRFYHPGDSSTVLNHNGDTQFTRNATKTDSNISILVRSGQVMDNVVIKPMIRDAAIEDDTYQPYAPTNRELYEMILALQNA